MHRLYCFLSADMPEDVQSAFFDLTDDGLPTGIYRIFDINWYSYETDEQLYNEMDHKLVYDWIREQGLPKNEGQCLILK